MNGKILYMALLLTVSAAGNESAENMRGIEFLFCNCSPAADSPPMQLGCFAH